MNPGGKVEVMATVNPQVRFISRVLERSASQSQDAMAHFQSKLANELTLLTSTTTSRMAKLTS